MKTVIMVEGDPFALEGEKGQLTTLYSIEDLKQYPNISEEEFLDCQETLKFWENNGSSTVVGFAKSIIYTDEEPSFVQMFDREVKELNFKGGM
jgi:hypothetical protein